MLNKVLQLLNIACRHNKMSQPFATAAAKPKSPSSAGWDPVAPAGKHYVVCFDCGKKFEYDWKKMKIVS